MELATFVVNAVVLEGRSVKEVAAAHDVSQSWLYELLARYRELGDEGLVPRSRRPLRSPGQIDPGMEDEIVAIRKSLGEEGYEAGPETIAYHLAKRHANVPSRSTVWRVLKRRGFITPEPHKRPKSSYVRFESTLPNACWQTDMTHVTLRGGRVVEVLNIIDDYSRLAISSTVYSVTNAHDVVSAFHLAFKKHGYPASVLSDNGAIFTASFRGDRGALATELALLGIVFKHGKPYHPQTQGKVERFHQTMKKHLDAKSAPRSMAELQAKLDLFIEYYNTMRPHRARGRITPKEAFDARVKAGPTGKQVKDAVNFRILHDKVGPEGKVTLRHAGTLFHIGIGREHKGKHVIKLVADLNIRILTAEGHLLRELTLDTTKNYQAR